MVKVQDQDGNIRQRRKLANKMKFNAKQIELIEACRDLEVIINRTYKIKGNVQGLSEYQTRMIDHKEEAVQTVSGWEDHIKMIGVLIYKRNKLLHSWADPQINSKDIEYAQSLFNMIENKKDPLRIIYEAKGMVKTKTTRQDEKTIRFNDL